MADIEMRQREEEERERWGENQDRHCVDFNFNHTCALNPAPCAAQLLCTERLNNV